MEIRKNLSKIRRLPWLDIVLYIAVIGSVSLVIINLVTWDFKTYIPVIGTLATIIAVILIYREMNLKNRPYLYSDNSGIRKRANEEVYEFQYEIKNCGNLPAKEVKETSTFIINGKDDPVPHLTETSEIYPNQSFIFSNKHIKYSPEDKVFYKGHIDYKGTNKKPYWYEVLYEIDLRMEEVYIIKVISG